MAGEPPAGKGGIPSLSLRPKGPHGLDRRGRAGQWPIGLSHSNSALSLFPSDLIENSIQIWFEL
jgi:hypothetical protein